MIVRQISTPDPPRYINERFAFAEIRAAMCHVAQEKAYYVYKSRFETPTTKANAVARLNAYKVNFQSTNDNLEIAFNQFSKSFVLKMAQNGALKTMFD